LFRRTAGEIRWLKVLGTLNEYQARLFVADKALDRGRGGITRLSELTGMSRTTMTKAVAALNSGKKLSVAERGRIRAVGGGRKKVEEADPGLQAQLGKLRSRAVKLPSCGQASTTPWITLTSPGNVRK
jgi:hypothetical protein